ncbi:MAG TPA: LTA synthase family protein [Planctomycetota bacterium]|nr:LTA synthase family protein [Planctomycetota bacterium]
MSFEDIKTALAGTPWWPAGRSVLGTLLKLYLLCIAIGAAGRLGMLVWQWGRLGDLSIGGRLLSLLHGLRMDTIVAGFALLLPALLLTLWPSKLALPAAVGIMRGWALAVVLLLAFMELASFPFFKQYDVRPNYLFVEYLRYPREVASMLLKDQLLSLILTIAALAAGAWAFFRLGAFREAADVLAMPWAARAVWCLPAALVLTGAIRSSFGHRPANLSDALYSANRVANEIAGNSLYCVAHAAMRSDRRRLAPEYGEIPMDEAYLRAHRLLGLAPSAAGQPFVREVAPSAPHSPPRNLVIIVEESMGAQFVGHLGDRRGLTPRIDALAGESLAFTQAYSNGTRSIEGLAAMSAGFQSLPGDGVLKRSKCQGGFFSLAALLKPLGYHASFVYGGEGRFDNMRSWFLGNGFDEFIEQKDYASPGFVSTWGVSDEDLMLKAHRRFEELTAAGRPFVSMVFSSSNHVPFELPEGRIQWVEGVPKHSEENAIRYADYAVGRFFEEARRSAYYANTVFVVVADHNVRVSGDDAVPVEAFRIPALIHAPGLEPRRHDGLVSQPDVLATALRQLGLPLRYPILGNAIDTPGRVPFVMMRFNDTFGFRRGEEVAVFRPDKPAQTYRLAGGRLDPAPGNPELERDGLALLHVVEDLCRRRTYR